MSELENLAAQAAAVDAEVAPAVVVDGAVAGAPASATVPAAPVFNAELEVKELATILQAVSSLFVPLFPSLATIYTEPTCQALAGGIIPVMHKRGWSVVNITAGLGEEIALAAIALPVAFATYKAVKLDIAAADKKDNPKPVALTTGAAIAAPVRPEPVFAERA